MPFHSWLNYVIPGPPAGQWFALLEGDNTGTPDGQTILYHLVADAGATMDVRLSKSTYAPGEQVPIEAILRRGGAGSGEEHTEFEPGASEPITDATVVARITRPGATGPDTPPLTLIHQSNGRYVGTYTNTGFPGTYDLEVVADITNPLTGTRFPRESRQSFYVKDPSDDPSTIVILGTDGVNIGSLSRVVSGVGVVSNQLTGPNPQLTVGAGATVPAGSLLAANSIAVAAGAVLQGSAYSNSLTETIAGTWYQGLTSFPPVNLPLFQYGQPATGPSGNRVVPNGGSLTLGPGRYRDIIARACSSR